MIQLEDKLYTSTEVADILGVSLRSVYRYLEEDKLTAEVKTATGRHRFTRKNILDFLYPQKEYVHKVPTTEVSAKVVKPAIATTSPVAGANAAIESRNATPSIDWLARFRAAQDARLKDTKANPMPTPIVMSAPNPSPLPVSSKPLSKLTI